MSPNLDISDHKMNYAQRMSQAHMKSVGMGDYTPRQSGKDYPVCLNISQPIN